MEDKTQYEAFMEELKKLANNFRDVVTELGDILAKILPDVEIPDEEEEDTWEMKCPYKDGDEYWFIYDNVVDCEYWEDTSSDTERFDVGNVFPTEETAELEVKRRNLLTRFRAFRDECNADWKADWSEQDKKHFLCYSQKFDVIYVNHISASERFNLFGYFKNESDANKAVELFGDEIKELFVEGEV